MPPRVLLALVVASLVVVPTAAADLADETALAEKHAPVVRLVTQEEECGPGEPYLPMDVEALFGDRTVALRGPWNPVDLVAIGPQADDLAQGLYEYHLDFPGNALNPGCDYERWARRITAGTEPTVYAHVVTDPGFPGKLALQYWFFYAFNDYNNKHEGDWEMVQVVFDADTAEEALGEEPVEVGYSQHEGAERSDWDADGKLELVDGTHPVVHPAAGSHANYYDEALFLGRSAEQGVGCDDTTGPTFEIRPAVQTIPSDAGDARESFPWITFEGRWGELQKAFYNGPTGPNLKGQWTEPILWTEGWRDHAYAIPAGGVLGTGATDLFCGGVATGSDVLRRAADSPLPVVLALLLVVALIMWAIAHATWHPTAPLRVARRRSGGQTLAAAGRLYASRPLLFIGIGVVSLPIAVIVSALQAFVVGTADFVGVEVGGEIGGLIVLLLVALSTALTLLGLALTLAATARAMVEIDEGRAVSVVSAYRLALGTARPLLGAFITATVVVTTLAASLFLIPVAIWLAVRWALFVPAVELEGRSAFAALRRSGELVRRQWLKVGTLVVLASAIALAIGPLVGTALIFVTSLPFSVTNILSGIVYAVALPFVALTAVYVYFDTLARERLDEPAPDELPAEIPAVTAS